MGELLYDNPVKNEELCGALKKAGWTQTELARRAGSQQCHVSNMVNGRLAPSWNLAMKMQLAFAEVDVFFDVLGAWPEGLGVDWQKRCALNRTFEISRVLGCFPEVFLDYRRFTGYEDVEKREIRRVLEKILGENSVGLSKGQLMAVRGVLLEGKSVADLSKMSRKSYMKVFTRTKKGFEKIRKHPMVAELYRAMFKKV